MFFNCCKCLFVCKIRNLCLHRIKNLKHIVQNNGQKKNKKSVKGEIDIRYTFTKESLKLISKQPFLGYGTGSFISVFSESTDSKHDF